MPRKRTIQGSIYSQRGRGKLIVKFAGKVHHTGLEDTKEGRKLAAQILERLYLESKGIGKVQVYSITVDEAFSAFLTVHCAQKSVVTKECYLYAVKAIVPENTELTAPNMERDVLRYLSEAKAKGHSQTTINDYLARFQVFLNFAHKRGWIERTEFAVRYKKAARVEVQNFSAEECAAIVQHCRHSSKEHIRELGLLIEFMLETGARPVDALPLKWSDVKPDGTINFLNKITKTLENVPLSDAALSVLERIPKRGEKVFRWQHSTLSRLRKWLNEVLEECGIESNGRSFKHFRTTFRNRLLDAEVAPEIAMRLMRHSDVRTTMKSYTKFSHETLRKGLKKLGNGSEKVAEGSTV